MQELQRRQGTWAIRVAGDFFKTMRYTHVPDTDDLFGQVSPSGGVGEQDYLKLPSSAAHLFGRPQVWTEGGGGLGNGSPAQGSRPAAQIALSYPPPPACSSKTRMHCAAP